MVLLLRTVQSLRRLLNFGFDFSNYDSIFCLHYRNLFLLFDLDLVLLKNLLAELTRDDFVQVCKLHESQIEIVLFLLNFFQSFGAQNTL